MSTITKEQLENAAVDAATIEDVANGGVNFNTTGYVTSRKNRQIRTLAKVIDDISKSGFNPPVNFSSGLSVDSSSFTVEYNGKTYYASNDSVPFITTSTFNPSQWNLLIKPEIASNFGEVAALGNTLAVPVGTGILTSGYATPGDGGEGYYIYSGSSHENNPEGGSFAPTYTYLRPERWGALGKIDDTSAIKQAVAYHESSPVESGTMLVAKSHEVSDTIVINKEINVLGLGFATSQFNNASTDKTVLHVKGEGSGFNRRNDFIELSSFSISTHAENNPAIHMEFSANSVIDRVQLWGNDVANKGALIGGEDVDELGRPIISAYLFSCRDLYADGFREYGLRYKSNGTLALIENPTIRMADDAPNAIALDLQGPLYRVTGGQVGANGANGTAVRCYNPKKGQDVGGSVFGMSFESLPGIGLLADGDGVITHVTWEGQRFNMSAQTGIGYKWGNAHHCAAKFPIVEGDYSVAIANGAYLAHWSALSQDCQLHVDIDGGKAPLLVDPSAISAKKYVYGNYNTNILKDITVYPNLTTIMVDNNIDLPSSFRVVHNGVNWNYETHNLVDNAVVVLSPPGKRGVITIADDLRPKHDMCASFNINNGNIGARWLAANATVGTADLTTGIVDGVDGNLNLSLHNGQLVLKNMSGRTAQYTVMYEDIVFGV